MRSVHSSDEPTYRFIKEYRCSECGGEGGVLPSNVRGKGGITFVDHLPDCEFAKKLYEQFPGLLKIPEIPSWFPFSHPVD
jgi:hypothetical protein